MNTSKEPVVVGQMMFATLAMQFNLKEKHPELRESILKEVKAWIKKDPGVVKSNMGGWHSKTTHTGPL